MKSEEEEVRVHSGGQISRDDLVQLLNEDLSGITGTCDKPTFGISVFHKTINKQITGDKSKHSGKSSSKQK